MFKQKHKIFLYFLGFLTDFKIYFIPSYDSYISVHK